MAEASNFAQTIRVGGWIWTRQKPGISHKQIKVGAWISIRHKPEISHKRAYL